MSGRPNLNVKTKSSGLGDFFRASTTRAEEQVSSPDSLQVPNDSPTKKRGSRLPFLGRPRKKSMQTDAHTVSESESIGDARSFGSKLAAHFTPSKVRAPSQRRSSRSLASDSLAPPKFGRDPSVDSVSSRSTTPRPTITVSPDLSEYDDLFTRPNRKSTITIQSDISDSTPPSPQISFPVGPEGGSTSSQRSSTSRTHLDSIVRQFTPVAEDADRTLTNASPLTPVEKRRSFPALPFKQERSRSLAASPLRAVSRTPTLPPKDPLPPPPSDRPSSKSIPRPRAQTLTTLSPAASLTSSNSVRRSSKQSALEKRLPDVNEPDKENLDIDRASVEQLRVALKAKINQFNELRNHLAKVTEAHEAEKFALENKVASLEKDAARKDKQIKGLTWLVSNNRPGSSEGGVGGNLSDSASKSMTSLSEAKNGRSSILRLPLYHHLEDSGAESLTSGAESPQSESSLSFQSRKVKRHKLIGSNLLRGHSLRQPDNAGLGSDLAVPDLPSLPKNAKRSSVSSLSSNTSTSSSLLTPSPTPTVMTHLSAIPEAPTTPPPKPPSSSLIPSFRSSRDPAIVAAIQAAEQLREKERSMRPKPPSQTPAAAYAANLKRGFAPSIAQVLNQSAAGQDKARPRTKSTAS